MRRLALLVTLGWLLAASIFWSTAIAHADPDVCGTGKFYNSYSNECIPTDRGAYPNTQPPNYGPPTFPSNRYGY